MWIYILICLCLSLAGVAGLQFFYMIYLDRLTKDHLKHIRQLEVRNKYLSKSLKKAEHQIAEQRMFIRAIPELEEQDDVLPEEIWADVIEEG